jgi:ribosomal-protein-alanine N-acetyltransferase
MGSGSRSGAAALERTSIRRAIAADLPQVVALERACYSDPWPASAFVSLPDNDRVFFAVAVDGAAGHITGYVVAWFVMDEGELANLAVVPGDRRRGIGRALLDSVLADAARRRIKRLFLEVRESNAAARQLYARAAFQQVGRRKQYYRSPHEDALILRREIGR